MPERLTWKAVFFIWLLAVPFVAGAGFVAYQKYPAPFRVAASWIMKESKVGMAQYKTWQAKRAKDAAEAAKRAKDAADQDQDQADN